MIEEKKQSGEAGLALPPGTVLRGRYRVDRPLGQGGFGITYSALDVKTCTRVAIKELFPSRNVTREENLQTVQIIPGQEDDFGFIRTRFEQEAQTLIRLQGQEGVVQLMHLFSENNTAYYVMELLEGEDLRNRLKSNGIMKWDELAPVLKTILNALEQIHAVGLIHRDISPDNIFLTATGARLIDFGSVRTYQGGTHFTAMLKRNFAPWEQFRTDGNQGPWTDIYSLAVTAYFALSGQLPPTAPERRIQDQLKSLESLCPNLPGSVCAAIHRGMAVLPENRFQSVKQFRSALQLSERMTVAAQKVGVVMCLQGAFSGKSWYLKPGTALRIGRNPGCEVTYPAGFQGISRAQCTIFHNIDGSYLIRDDNSSYGTRMKMGGKLLLLQPEKWYRMEGCHILIGSGEEYIMK